MLIYYYYYIVIIISNIIGHKILKQLNNTIIKFKFKNAKCNDN